MGTQANGADGLGGAGDAVMEPRDGDELLEDNEWSPGDEFEPDLEGAVTGADGLNGAALRGADPFEGWSDEAKRKAEEKGWKSPEEAARAYAELEGKLGQRESDEMREMREQLDDMRAQLRSAASAPSAQQQPAAGGDLQSEIEELFAPVAFDAIVRDATDQYGNVDTGKALAIYHENIYQPRFQKGLALLGQELLQTVRQEMGGQIQPLQKGMTRVAVRDEAQQLANDFPADFPELREALTKRVQRDPSVLQREGGMRAVFNELLAEKVRGERARADRQAEGETLTGGRRTSPARQAAPDVDKEIRDAIAGVRPSMRDGL